MTGAGNGPDREAVLGSRHALRDTMILALGTGLSGLAAYGYVILGTRYLGAVRFAPISVLWTFWAISAAVLTFPVMHWVIRSLEADQGEGRVRSALPLLAGLAVVVSVVAGLVAWTGRETLFQQQGWVFPVLAALIPFGSIAVGLARGSLAGRRRFVATSGAIAAENLIRLIAAAIVVWAGGGQGVFAAALIAGFGASVLWPTALVFPPGRHAPKPVSSLVFLGGVAGGSLIAQIIITGGPVVLAVLGGAPAEITALFAALALFRAPYMVATGVAARITGTLTGLVVRRERRRLRRVYLATIGAGIAALPVGGAFGALAGPWLLGAVFGPQIQLSRTLVGVLGAGSAVALVGLFYTLALVAGARTTLVTVGWLVALVVGGAWSVAGPGGPLERVAWAFCLAEIVALVVMLAGSAQGMGSVSSGGLADEVEGSPDDLGVDAGEVLTDD